MQHVLSILKRLLSWLIDKMPLPPARLEYGNPIPAIKPDFGVILKQTLNKTSRKALVQQMLAMCRLSGWQATTLNPGMSNSDKMALVTARYSKVALTDDADLLYDELVGLAATTMGWAQAISKQQRKAAKK
jgi:hypothetical protein